MGRLLIETLSGKTLEYRDVPEASLNAIEDAISLRTGKSSPGGWIAFEDRQGRRHKLNPNGLLHVITERGQVPPEPLIGAAPALPDPELP